MQKPSIINDLLGQDTNVVHYVLDKGPNEAHLLSSGDKLFKHIGEDIRSSLDGTQGKAVECADFPEKRTNTRVSPADLVRVVITDKHWNEYRGTLTDMSVDSVKVRIRNLPDLDANTLTRIRIEFGIPEAGLVHPVTIDDGIIRRISSHGVECYLVATFKPRGYDHPYFMYIRCRQTEKYYGQKWCERSGGKCRGLA